ncbi:MAG TPA: sensor domain-containing diguanylate cyclase, partial [Candidatus Wujingus californicus]
MNQSDSIKLDEYLFNLTDNNTEKLKERFFELLILYSLNKNLNLSIQLEDLLNTTLNFLKDSLKIEEFCFMLLDNNRKVLKVWT